ncbi:MAG TPA: N-acetyltransferase [Gammaproteobacteria bacterium]|nr:N-acetyltransferase [Gammaproteobacteria bacterium]
MAADLGIEPAHAREQTDLRIEPANAPEQIEHYIRFPFELYRGDPHWVPPLLMERRDFLNPRKNPVYEYAEIQAFLARRGEAVVGTITAIKNRRFAEFHPAESHVGFFGLYECRPDAEASDALLGAAADWLRTRECRVMRGPTNFTTNDVLGLLVEGYDDDPAILMPYNPPYYAEQFAAFRLRKVKDLYALELEADAYKGQLERLSGFLLGKGRIQVRPVDLKRWHEELAFVRRCYNEAWADNWGFVPWTDAELAALAKELKPLIDRRLAFVGEVDGEPAAISIAVPDAHEGLKLARGRLFPLGLLKILWRIKVAGCTRIRVLVLGVLPKYRRLGLDALLMQRTIESAIARGYERAELGWILEDNDAMLRPLRHIDAKRTKVYRVYDRAL